MRSLMILVPAAAAYGFSVGLAHSLLYASRNLIKLPLLLLFTSVVCALACFVVALFCGVRLSFGRVQSLTLELFRDVAVLLASLAPANVLLALSFEDGSALGEYDLFLGCNLAFVASSGTLALIRQGHTVLRDAAVPAGRVIAVVGLWLLLSLIVGGQGAFYLRPMFGYPASRGQDPPWFLGSEADVRGATNFFEMVYQTLTKPPLPEGW